MTSVDKPSWQFVSRFRRGAYGWRSSSTVVTGIKEAVAEIRKVARKDPVLAAEGAVDQEIVSSAEIGELAGGVLYAA